MNTCFNLLINLYGCLWFIIIATHHQEPLQKPQREEELLPDHIQIQNPLLDVFLYRGQLLEHLLVLVLAATFAV